jgi:hypothetical protein
MLLDLGTTLAAAFRPRPASLERKRKRDADDADDAA